jgi:flavin reductase (DIM6/NTAB) family NADH-FMN oxidoreductase RutF
MADDAIEALAPPAPGLGVLSAALDAHFRGAMRQTASGVTVIATDGRAGREGVTVSTFCSLSLEPPSVIACISRTSRCLPVLMENGAFVANVLAEDQSDVASAFAGHIDVPRQARFESGRWSTLVTGSPVLERAVASFDCRLATSFDFGSHRIVIGVIADVVQRPEARPLLFSDRRFRRMEG